MQPLKSPRSHASYNEEINRLKAELEDAREEAAAWANEGVSLERQLAESELMSEARLRTVIERNGIIDNLRKQLAEAKSVSKTVERLEQKLSKEAEFSQELSNAVVAASYVFGIDREPISCVKIAAEKYRDLCKQLEQVERENNKLVQENNNLIKENLSLKIHKKVRVLLMKLEE